MTDEKKARRVIDFIQCLRHTKGEFHGKPFKLLPWQEKIIRDVFGTVREDDPTMRQYTTAYIEIPKKQGKALALSTLLPTPQGWKQMEDIRVGDQVFDEGGRPCNVVALSEIFDDETCYRLTFRDGSSIEAGERHLWRVGVTNNGKREKLLTSGEIYHRTAKYRRRHPGNAGKRSVIRIPVARALQLPERELPIDPYLMGYWLGNGSSTDYEITVRDSDVEAVRAQIPYEIKSEVVQPGSHSCAFRRSRQYWSTVSETKPFLQNTCGPRRTALVASSGAHGFGRLYQQGEVAKRIRQHYPPLAESVRELLWSLGVKNAMTVGPSLRYGEPTGETLYTIRFTTFDDQPTSRPKKKI